MKRLLFIFIVVMCSRSYAQNVAINNSGSSANASAMLDISSTNKGLLIPRVYLTSLTDEVTIVNPATSLLVYNTNATVGEGFYYNSNTAGSPSWTKLISNASGSGWSLGGNAAAATDFIGTINFQPLKFKVNNNTAGIIDYNNENTALGYLSLTSNFGGIRNSAYGVKSLFSNSTGTGNVAVGYESLFSNIGGSSNVALGPYSMYSNINGISNFAAGINSLFTNISGKQNIAIGENALTSNTSGNDNVGLGYGAMFYNKTGYSNIAIGYSSLSNHKTGNYNVANGAYSLQHDTSGNNNIATGQNALYGNISGNNNIGIGYNSLYQSTTGNDNIAIGREAMYKNTNVSENIAVGFQALYNNTLGYKNTAIGIKSLTDITTGYQNTAIGYGANMTGSRFNSTAIGANAFASCSNCMVLGPSTAGNNLKVGIGVSDPQAYVHINPNDAGSILIGTSKITGGYTNLEFGITQQSGGYSYIQSTEASGVNKGNLAINPAGGKVSIHTDTAKTDLHIKQSNESYPLNGGGLRLERQNSTNHWDLGVDSFDDIDFIFNGVAKGYINDATGVFTTVSDIRMKKDIQSVGSVLPALMQLQPKTYHYIDNKNNSPLSYGFIAQEVEKLFPDFVFTKGADEMKAISYQNFTIVAIKAIQEQQKEIESLKEQNRSMMEEQQKAIQKIEERMKLLENK